MKKLLIILTIIGINYSCSTKSSTNSKTELIRDSVDTRSISNQLDNSDIFLKLFPELNINDFHIYTPPYDSVKRIRKFDGKRIDRSFYEFLLFKNYENPLELDTFYHYYACYKFKLTGNKTGLLIRRPSQYVESAIDLYTWDNSAKKVTDIINLTDAFGDEGWHFVQDAWIEDLNKDKFYDIVIRRKDFDRNLEDTTKIFRSDSTSVYLGNGNTFRISRIMVDNNKYQLKHWKE